MSNIIKYSIETLNQFYIIFLKLLEGFYIFLFFSIILFRRPIQLNLSRLQMMNNSIYNDIKKYLFNEYSSYNFLIHTNKSLNEIDAMLDNIITQNTLGDCEKMSLKNPEDLNVVNIRKLIDFTQKSNWTYDPNSNKTNYKIILIYNAHCLNNESLSLLLKTLERDDISLIFFLCTSYVYSLAKTLRSRCFLLLDNDSQYSLGSLNWASPIIKLNQLKNSIMYAKGDIGIQQWKEFKTIIFDYIIYQKSKSKPLLTDCINDLEEQIYRCEKFNFNKKQIALYLIQSIS